MHATLRRIKTKPGQAAEVARLIESEYLPQIESVDGFVSYTLVDVGDDEVASLGIFTGADRAHEANEKAKAWTQATLGPYVDSRLGAREGSVLLDHRNA